MELQARTILCGRYGTRLDCMRPEQVEDQIQCGVSTGTGVPSMKSFQDDLVHIDTALITNATETEQRADTF